MEFWIAMRLAVQVSGSMEWSCKCKLQVIFLVAEGKKGRKTKRVREKN